MKIYDHVAILEALYVWKKPEPYLNVQTLKNTDRFSVKIEKK